jgi:hypothetical protein
VSHPLGAWVIRPLRPTPRAGYRHPMHPIVGAVTLPWRVGVAFTQTTLQLGRLVAADGPLLRTGGYADQLGRLVERLIADDGALERLLAPGGALDQLVAREGALDRLLAPGGALDRLTTPGGVLDRVLEPGGLADRMLTEDGFVEKLVSEGGTLEQLVGLGATLEAIRPQLTELAALIPTLADSADALGRTVGPLGELAGRIPLSRRKSIGPGA